MKFFLLKIIIVVVSISSLGGCISYENKYDKAIRESREHTKKLLEDSQREREARAKEEQFNFYGIQVSSEKYDYGFTTIVGGMFNTLPSEMNTDIYAKINTVPSDENFIIWINNGSSKPFNTNYFTDEYTMLTKDDRLYILKKEELGSYPKYSSETQGYINPNDSIGAQFSLPYGVKIADVKKFVAKVGWDVRIVMKRLKK
jgi:hypothetical protein